VPIDGIIVPVVTHTRTHMHAARGPVSTHGNSCIYTGSWCRSVFVVFQGSVVGAVGALLIGSLDSFDPESLRYIPIPGMNGRSYIDV
jgi:hypothetical protein